VNESTKRFLCRIYHQQKARDKTNNISTNTPPIWNGLPIFDAVHHNVDDDPELGTTRRQSTPSTSSHHKKKKN
jgi:hypothetical protein